MDFRYLYTNIQKSNRALGIHIEYSSAEPTLNIALLKRKGSSVSLASSWKVPRVSEIDKSIHNLPSTIVITGNKVVYKQVDNSSKESMLSEIIPVGKKSEFYYKIYKIDERRSWVAIIRKSILTELLKELKDNKIFVTGIHLGEFCISNILPLLTSYETVSTRHKCIHFDGERILSVESLSEPLSSLEYLLGEERISSDDILSYSSAIYYYSMFGKNDDEDFHSILNSYSYYRKLRLLLMNSLAVILIALLVNFMLFTSYRGEYNILHQSAAISKSDLVSLDSLKQKVAYYKALIKKNSLDSKSNHAYICDRLISNMPKGILLKTLSINSASKKIRKSEQIRYDDGIVVIEGECSSPKTLERWIELLSKEEWMSLVLGQEYYSTSDKGDFSLKIKLKEE